MIMADFLEVIEEVKRDCSNLNSDFEKNSYNPRESKSRLAKHKGTAKYKEGLRKAVDFLESIKRGRKPTWQFKEAMTTSDFPLYFGDVMDRSVIAEYQAAETNWRQISQVGTVGDFRDKKMFDFSGPDQHLEEVIGEKQEYPMSKIDESERTYRLFKRGRIFDISWETLINDDLDVFQKVPQWFARAAIRTEERFHTGLYASATGPNTDLYTAPGGNVTNGNLGTGVLNVNNLGIAIASTGMMVDPEKNEPIWNNPQYLVIPPSLRFPAERILNSVNLVWQVVEGVQGAEDIVNRPFPTQNFLRNQLTIIVNPYLPLIDTTSGMTAWYLFASPSEAPATEVGFLRGYEEPQIFIKASDQQRVGGAVENPLAGDFMSDNIMYKVRHILGGTQVRAASGTQGVPATYASTGTTDTITNYPDNTAVVEPVA